MLVIHATYVASRTKGYLSRYLLEISPSVFIGNVTARVRTDFIQYFTESLGKQEGVIMMWSTNTAQGYHILQFGETARISDIDGVYLVNKPIKPIATEAEASSRLPAPNGPQSRPKDWAKVSRQQAAKKFKRRG